jgi:hypothetical protein
MEKNKENEITDNNKKLIKEYDESKIPKIIKKSIIELLKLDIPYEGIISQLEFEDSWGNKKIPSKSVVKKLWKEYLKDMVDNKDKTDINKTEKNTNDLSKQKLDGKKKKKWEKERKKEELKRQKQDRIEARKKRIIDKMKKKKEEKKMKSEKKEKEGRVSMNKNRKKQSMSRRKIKFKRIGINSKIRKGFIAIFCIILFISSYSSIVAFQQPTTKKETISICDYNQRGNFDYTVYLKSSTFYDDKKTLKPGQDLIFKKITDSIDGSFNYKFTCNQTGIINISYKVDADLSTNVWSKVYNLIPLKTFEIEGYTGNFTINFPIDFVYFEDIIDRISDETGVFAGEQTLDIKCSVFLNARLKNANISESFSHSLSINLGNNIIETSDNLSQTISDKLFDVREVFQPELVEYQQNSLIAPFAFIIILIAFIGLTKSKVITISKAEKIMLKLLKKYGEWIIEVDNPTSMDSIKNVIKLKSSDDIIKISEELGKPIFYYQDSLNNEKKYNLYILDGEVQYIYILDSKI